MPRDGSNTYSLPAGSLATANTLATASTHNTPLQDIETDLNTARPIVAGGTGATTAAAARTNLGVAAAYETRNAGNAALAAALSDGVIVQIAGLFYEVDSSKTGTSSATNDLSVDGLIPLRDVTPAHCGDSLANADTLAVALGRDLLIDEDIAVAASVTVDAPVRVTNGATFVPASGQTITFAAHVSAGRVQIFDLTSSGDVLFTAPQTVFPEWFGTGNTAVHSAFKKSAAGSLISLAGKTYETVAIAWNNDPLETSPAGADTGKVIEGPTPAQRYKTTGAFYAARLKLADGEDDHVFTIDSGGANEYGTGGLRNLMIDGNKGGQTTDGNFDGIYIDDVKDMEFHNVSVWNCSRHGWNIEGSNNQLRITGHCESWNNGNYTTGGMGFRIAAAGDVQGSGALVAVNNGNRGIYIATVGGKFGHLYAYFNLHRGVDIDALAVGNVSVDFIEAEDNGQEGVFVASPNFAIGSIQVGENGQATASAGLIEDATGLRLRPTARGWVGSVSSSKRTASFYTTNGFGIDYDGKTTDFVAGETLTGGTSGATATIARVNKMSSTTGSLILGTITGGPFQNNEAITSASGAAVANLASWEIGRGYLVYDDSLAGVVIDRMDDHGITSARTQTFYTANPTSAAAARVQYRPPKVGTYASVKDSGVDEITPKTEFGAYVVTAISAACTINDTAANSANQGMEMTFQLTDDGSARTITWDSAYVNAAGTALSSTALGGGETAWATFRRQGSQWMLTGAVEIV